MSKIPELLRKQASTLREQAKAELDHIEALGFCATHLLDKAAEENKTIEVAEQFLHMVKSAGVESNLDSLVSEVEQKLRGNPFDVASARIAQAAIAGTISKEAADKVIEELSKRKTS